MAIQQNRMWRHSLRPVLGAVGFSLALTSVARAADEILIGGTLCLTGIQAPLDEPGLRGAELAVKVINAAGGVLGKNFVSSTWMARATQLRLATMRPS